MFARFKAHIIARATARAADAKLVAELLALTETGHLVWRGGMTEFRGSVISLIDFYPTTASHLMVHSSHGIGSMALAGREGKQLMRCIRQQRAASERRAIASIMR